MDHQPPDVLRVVHEVTKRVHASLDLAETLDAVARGVHGSVGFAVTYLSLVMPDDHLEICTALGLPDAVEALTGLREPVENMRRMLAMAEADGSLRYLDHRTEGADAVLDTFWVPDVEPIEGPDAWHPDDLFCALLTTPQGEWLGILGVDVPLDGRRPDRTQRRLLEVFADHAAIAIMHARLHAELVASRETFERAATHDALTGLGNRALLAAHEHLDASPAAPVAVVVVDLDGFKAVNDACGHEAGDEVLQVVAERMRGCVREGDLLVRTGGDEFVVVLAGPGADVAAGQLSTRLHEVLAQPVVGRTGTHRVGASTGSATSTAPSALTTLLAAADAEMYQHKREHHDARAAAARSAGRSASRTAAAVRPAGSAARR